MKTSREVVLIGLLVAALLAIWIYRERHIDVSVLRATRLTEQAQQLSQGGRTREAIELLKQSEPLFLSLGRVRNELAIGVASSALLTLSELYEQQGRIEEARHALAESLTLHKQLLKLGITSPATNPQEVARLELKLSLLAKESAQSTQDSSNHLGTGPGHGEPPAPELRTLAAQMAERARLLVQKHRYDAAEALYRDAIQTYEESLGPDDSSLVALLEGWGQLYVQLEKYHEAVPLLQRAIYIRKKRLAGDTSGLQIATALLDQARAKGR